jgi:hypothetical protein
MLRPPGEGSAGGATAVIAADAILRANPAYELVSLERLAAEERAVLNGAAGEDDLYGLLRPREGTALAPRSASTSVALLVLSLAEPGPLPAFAAKSLGGGAVGTIERLVLDGVLELDVDGRFVSGAAALDEAGEPERLGTVAELSLEAARHVSALEGVAPELLALRLYCYGRRPLTPSLQARFPDEDSVARFLQVDRAEAQWTEVDAEDGGAWRSWRPRGLSAPRGRAAAGFKLYVAPELDALPDAFAPVAETLAGTPSVLGFKVARDVAGLCRPDKLVAYFQRFEDLRAAVPRLRERLGAMTAQPVPFTGEVAADGLLSWGVDPLPSETDGQSWRLWLAIRLAEYIVEARLEGADEPWRFAIERLRLDGIDTTAWAPFSTGWDGSS